MLFAVRLDNDGKLQVKSNNKNQKKHNVMAPSSHMFHASVAYFVRIDNSKKTKKGIEEERKFAIGTIDIYLKEGLLGFNDNPNEPYLFVKNWDIYKASKAGPKTEWTREKVEDILRENSYNMTKAAKSTGNTKQFFSFLAKKFGIKKPEARKG